MRRISGSVSYTHLPSGTTGLYLHEESFSSEHHLVGLFAQCNEYFYAGDWDFRGARFTLRLSLIHI